MMLKNIFLDDLINEISEILWRGCEEDMNKFYVTNKRKTFLK